MLNLHVASGLLWLSEVIEEHSRTSKLVGVRATYVRFPQRPRILPCSDLRFFLNKDYHCTTHSSLVHRCTSISAHCILHNMSSRIPHQLHTAVAIHFPFIILLYGFMRLSAHGPLHLVYVLLATNSQGATISS